MNFMTISGRIATDLNLKNTQNGTVVLPFNVAVQRDYKNKQTNEYDTDFFQCLATNKIAEFLANYAGKGDFIALNGRMQNNNYTKDDGTQVQSMQLRVNNVDSGTLFLNKHERQGQQQQNMGQQQQNMGQNNWQQGQAQQQKGQNNWQQQNNQQRNNQQNNNNPFANNNGNGPIDINEDDLPF